MGGPIDAISEFVFVEHQVTSADIVLVPGDSAAELAYRAADVYREGMAPLILPSGGPNLKLARWPSEWHFLRSLLLEKGVPAGAIPLGDAATSARTTGSWMKRGLRSSSANSPGFVTTSRAACTTWYVGTTSSILSG